ncbi:dna replication helicase dna2 [Moniliophthora roreri MCA 2997]|uniref:DNA replication ATP-dependent helicase/nuclease DNA2 n=1 Tax=Moniliophthora roreri (strain MCA 2997) TaxID=1381753 RepID=V2XFN7_MONRO|nr:dna replication helicase dna2 [Moniliophthora roreri MCA 2997]
MSSSAARSRSEAEEVAFMKELLSEMDDSFWNAVPSPDPSPVKSKKKMARSVPRTPVKPHKHVPVKLAPPSSSRVKVFSATSDEIDADALMQGVEDWDWDMNFEISPKKKSPGKPAASKLTAQARETCTRCTVDTVSEVKFQSKLSKQLLVRVDNTGEHRSVILQDDWVTTDVRSGDTVNILGDFTPQSPSSSSVTLSITISTKSNTIILHPDILLTATALSTAAHCRRKALLSGLVRSSTDVSPALVWGHMLHTVFQTCLSSKRWDDVWLDEQIDGAVRANLMDLVRINMDVEQAKREVKARAKGIQTFFDRYLSIEPKSEAVLSNTRAGRNQSALLAISEVLDIEEDIWSPTYGLKGKLDATVETTISESNFLSPKPTLVHGPKPFEIKTGRSNGLMEHRAQTMLYTLLAQERYGIDVTSGLLYYTQSEEVVQVPTSRNELRGLIIARNEIAAYMKRRHVDADIKPSGSGSITAISQEPFLPPTIDDERTCKRCYSLDTCMLYRKAVEDVVDNNSPIADVYSLKTSHLTPSQAAFFKDWEHLLSLEEQDISRFRKELWTMGAAEREAKGRCFSSMVLDPSLAPRVTGVGARDGKIHSFTYRFVRAPSAAPTSLLNGFLDVNDAVTVSVEPHLIALARGFIVSLNATEVTIGADHDLSLPHIRARLAAFTPSSPPNIVFRIDRDELHGGMGRVRNNLAQMFYADGDIRRLELVVDLRKPVFEDVSSLVLPPSVFRHSEHLNPNQQEAMKQVLRARDYALILGMPGTGKTTVIAAMIKTLVEMGKTVLLTSYTHSAVDTILMKLKDESEFGILRLGNVDKVHPDVRKFTLSARRQATTVEQLEHQLTTPSVVATTALSIDHALFSRRQFDYCIVDEASQITLPTCLGPLRFADKFVLVGDHFQLPPLVRNPRARKGGLDVSLFRRLSDFHPHAIVDLAYQYRMNSDIMDLSNKLIYSDRLRCGSEEIANRGLVLPDRSFLIGLHQETGACCAPDCWIERLMSESCKAVFVDTDLVPCFESKVGDLVQNEGEARIVHQIAETLVKSGIQPDQMGIISVYRQQIKLLAEKLRVHDGIEFMTVDKSQGRDKDCIIISLVRSNNNGFIGELVKDWRRMNVSFTRARSKLIIIGSRKTLAGAELLNEFFKLMEDKGWILQLPPRADVVHSGSFPSGNKRSAEGITEKENPLEEQPQKRLRRVEEDVLTRSRPILKDLVNDAK